MGIPRVTAASQPHPRSRPRFSAGRLLLLLHLLWLPSNNALPPPPQSEFPRSPDARIGIVGAGPAGLHMAYLLRSLNYTNILLLDSASRVGGRTVTLADPVSPDLVHELGACYLSSDYADLRRMASGIGYPLDELTLPEAVLRASSESGPADQLSLAGFVLARLRRLVPGLGPDSGPVEVASAVATAQVSYLRLRERLFLPAEARDYMEFPLAPPAPDAMSQLNCSLAEFLSRWNMTALEPYFLLGMTAMGYGDPRDTSAMYGLMWMTPAYLADLTSPRNQSRLAVLSRGFQHFWDAAKSHLNSTGGVQLRLSDSVTRVTRTRSSVRLELSTGRKETLDWLVWTPGLHSTSHLFADLQPAEATAAAGLASRRFRTRLVRLPPDSPVSADAVAYYLDALELGDGDADTGVDRLNRLMAVRNSGRVNLSNQTDSVVAYYLSGYSESVHSADTGTNGGTDSDRLDAGETLANMRFDYMPRYSIADMAAGALWRPLEASRGSGRRTWFAGYSVVFDSVKSVMKYNKMLLLAEFPELADFLASV